MEHSLLVLMDIVLFIVRYHCNMRIKNQTHFSLDMNCTYNFKIKGNTMHAYIINALRMPIGTLM